MEIGKYDKRIRIEKPAEPQADSGEIQTRFILYKERWAAIEPLRGQEHFSAQQLQGVVDTRIRIRYLAGVTEKMRVLHVRTVDGKKMQFTYQINAVIPPTLNYRDTQLMCMLTSSEGFTGDGSDV